MLAEVTIWNTRSAFARLTRQSRGQCSTLQKYTCIQLPAYSAYSDSLFFFSEYICVLATLPAPIQQFSGTILGSFPQFHSREQHVQRIRTTEWRNTLRSHFTQGNERCKPNCQNRNKNDAIKQLHKESHMLSPSSDKTLNYHIYWEWTVLYFLCGYRLIEKA